LAIVKIRRYIISALASALLAGIPAAAAMQSRGVEQTSPGTRQKGGTTYSTRIGAFRMSDCGR
jgi:hypothetical protein